jgi:hypothetical protein
LNVLSFSALSLFSGEKKIVYIKSQKSINPEAIDASIQPTLEWLSKMLWFEFMVVHDGR